MLRRLAASFGWRAPSFGTREAGFTCPSPDEGNEAGQPVNTGRRFAGPGRTSGPALVVAPSALPTAVVVVESRGPTSVRPSERSTPTVAPAALVRRSRPRAGPILASSVPRWSAVAPTASPTVRARGQREPIPACFAFPHEHAVVARGEPQGGPALPAGPAPRRSRVESFGPFPLPVGSLGPRGFTFRDEDGRGLAVRANHL